MMTIEVCKMKGMWPTQLTRTIKCFSTPSMCRVSSSEREGEGEKILHNDCSVLGRELTRQNRLAIFVLIIGSIVVLLSIVLGAPFYYYRYSRSDAKASISKNPNYG
jgi:hypothetical protein